MKSYLRFVEGGNFRFNVLSYGTIVYLKCRDNSVRECRIVGFRVDGMSGKPLYEYEVAGLDCHIKDEFTHLTYIGATYPTLEMAKHSPADFSKSNWDIEYRNVVGSSWGKVEISIYPLEELIKKYNYDKSLCSFQQLHVPMYYFCAYKLNADGTLKEVATDVDVHMNANGVHISIPAIDSGELYATKEDAYSHYNCEVITFGNSHSVVNEEEKKYEVTINVDIKVIRALKSIGVDIDSTNLS